MKISWHEVAELRHGQVGHGVLFYAGELRTHFEGRSKFSDESAGPDDLLVAVVHGYGWLHGRTDETVVWIRRPDATFDAEFLALVRGDISSLLLDPSLFRQASPRLSPRIYIHAHG